MTTTKSRPIAEAELNTLDVLIILSLSIFLAIGVGVTLVDLAKRRSKKKTDTKPPATPNLENRPIRVYFQVNEAMIESCYEQADESPLLNHIVKLSKTVKDEIGAELKLINASIGREQTVLEEKTLNTTEKTATRQALAIERLLVKYETLDRVDLTGEEPFEKFLAHIALDTQKIGWDITADLQERMREEWRSQQSARVPSDRIRNLRGFIILTSQFTILSAPSIVDSQKDLVLHAEVVTSNDTGTTISEITVSCSSDQVIPAQHHGLENAQEIMATTFGFVVRQPASPNLRVTPLCCYWS